VDTIGCGGVIMSKKEEKPEKPVYKKPKKKESKDLP
jgi:hypothetical protein